MHRTDWMFVSEGRKGGKVVKYYVCLTCHKSFILGYDGSELPEEH